MSVAGEFELQGVDTCGETKFVVTNSAQLFEWKEFGLKIRIREETLPEGVECCTVRIKASLAGQYQFPQNFHLVSAVFWLRCEPICKFAKSITMEMEHCAKSENTSKLSFVRSVCTQEKLPYIFRKLGGTFTCNTCYGTIEMNGFSGHTIAQEGSDEREYGARIYNIHRSITSYKIDFVVTWNTKAHLTVSVVLYTLILYMYMNVQCFSMDRAYSNQHVFVESLSTQLLLK